MIVAQFIRSLIFSRFRRSIKLSEAMSAEPTQLLKNPPRYFDPRVEVGFIGIQNSAYNQQQKTPPQLCEGVFCLGEIG